VVNKLILKLATQGDDLAARSEGEMLRDRAKDIRGVSYFIGWMEQSQYGNGRVGAIAIHMHRTRWSGFNSYLDTRQVK